MLAVWPFMSWPVFVLVDMGQGDAGKPVTCNCMHACDL